MPHAAVLHCGQGRGHPQSHPDALRGVPGSVVPGLTVLPTGLLDGLSHLAEKLTSDTSTGGLTELSTICFSLHQIMAHKTALAGAQAVKQEDHPNHPFLFQENTPLSLHSQAVALRLSAPGRPAWRNLKTVSLPGCPHSVGLELGHRWLPKLQGTLASSENHKILALLGT